MRSLGASAVPGTSVARKKKQNVWIVERFGNPIMGHRISEFFFSKRKTTVTFQPHWEEKCWGRVQHIFASDYTAVSHLEIVKGFRCSMHRHFERTNLFAVIEGRVQIIVRGYSRQPSDEQIIELGPGDVTTVLAWVWHRFVVLESGRMVEVYERSRPGSVCRLDDIQREDEGGPIETSA